MKDRLILLKPDFLDGGPTKFFCAECGIIEGMLSFYPQLRENLDVRYVNFPRPRPEVVAELGPDNQGLPVLILGNPEDARRVPPTVRIKTAAGKRFIQDEYEICNYLAARYGAGSPHE